MYLSKLTISGFRQFGLGDAAAELTFQPGVTALIGKNDSGKTAIIDAVRYALLSRDQMYFKVQPEDFHVDAAGSSVDDIRITCVLSDLGTVRRQGFWHQRRPKLRERLAHLVDCIMRRAGGDASVALRASFV